MIPLWPARPQPNEAPMSDISPLLAIITPLFLLANAFVTIAEFLCGLSDLHTGRLSGLPPGEIPESGLRG
jgi:hypothetical protein